MFAVGTLVAPNPVTGTVALGAKVAQAGLAVGQVAFAERPLLEAVEVGATFLLGRAGGAAAGAVFRRAGASGLISEGIDAAAAQLTPIVNRGFNRAGRALREVRVDTPLWRQRHFQHAFFCVTLSQLFVSRSPSVERWVQTSACSHLPSVVALAPSQVSDDLFDRAAETAGPLITSTLQTSQEVSSLLDQGNAFLRTATQRGTNIAKYARFHHSHRDSPTMNLGTHTFPSIHFRAHKALCSFCPPHVCLIFPHFGGSGLQADASAYANAQIDAVTNFASSGVVPALNFFGSCVVSWRREGVCATMTHLPAFWVPQCRRLHSPSAFEFLLPVPRNSICPRPSVGVRQAPPQLPQTHSFWTWTAMVSLSSIRPLLP